MIRASSQPLPRSVSKERSTGLSPCAQETRLTRLHLHPSPKQRRLRPCVLPPSAVMGASALPWQAGLVSEPPLALGQREQEHGASSPSRDEGIYLEGRGLTHLRGVILPPH